MGTLLVSHAMSFVLKILTFLLLVPPLLLFPGCGTVLAAQNVLAVFSADLPSYQDAHEAFLHALAEAGQPSIRSERITLAMDPTSRCAAVRSGLAPGPDLVLTYGALATRMVREAGAEVPVIFAGLQRSEALEISEKPGEGGAICGICAPPLETLILTTREIRNFRRLGVLFSSGDPDSIMQVKILEKLGRKYQFSIFKSDIRDSRDLATALQSLSPGVDALFLSDSPELYPGIPDVVEFSNMGFLPLISQIPGLADRGALVTLEIDPSEEGKMMAEYARHYFSGGKITALPIRPPRKISLVINLKAAREMNITIPFSALCRATRVIR
jgi:putative ABC transport system substrate-binding protein